MFKLKTHLSSRSFSPLPLLTLFHSPEETKRMIRKKFNIGLQSLFRTVGNYHQDYCLEGHWASVGVGYWGLMDVLLLFLCLMFSVTKFQLGNARPFSWGLVWDITQSSMFLLSKVRGELWHEYTFFKGGSEDCESIMFQIGQETTKEYLYKWRLKLVLLN